MNLTKLVCIWREYVKFNSFVEIKYDFFFNIFVQHEWMLTELVLLLAVSSAGYYFFGRITSNSHTSVVNKFCSNFLFFM